MKTPVLILGYERSGTTLLRRIVSMHPSLKYGILHERKGLFEFKSRAECESKYWVKSKQEGKFIGGRDHILSGEKIAYINNVVFIKKYIDKWIRWWPESCCIHITRTMEDCIESQHRTFGHDKKLMEACYQRSVQPILIHIRENFKDNFYHLTYDDLINNPLSTIYDLYNFIHDGYNIDSDLLNKICTTKEPWIFKKKSMCGLRYFDKIGITR